VSKQLFDPKDDDDDDDVDDHGLNLHSAPRSNTTRAGHPITHASLESRPRKLSLDLIAKSALSFSSSLWDRVTDPRLNHSHSIPDDAHASDRSPQSMLHTSTPSVQSTLSGPSRWVAQARLWPAEDSDNFIVDEANDGITNGTNGCISASTGSTVPFTLKRILSIIRTCARTATELDHEAGVTVHDMDTCTSCLSPAATSLPPREVVTSLTSAVTSLLQLVERSPERQAIVIEHDGCEALLSAGHNYIPSDAVCLVIFRALRWLSQSRLGVNRLNRLQGVRYVVGVLTAYPSHKELILIGCHILCCMMIDHRTRKDGLNMGVLEVLHVMLENNLQCSRDTYKDSCSTESGNIGNIADNNTKWNSSFLDIESVAKVVFSLVHDHPENREQIGIMSLCESLVRASLSWCMMSTQDKAVYGDCAGESPCHTGNNAMQGIDSIDIDIDGSTYAAGWSLRALGAVACQSTRNKQALMKLGCCELATQMLKTRGLECERGSNEARELLLEGGCFAMAQLAQDNSDIQGRFLEAGAGEVLSRVLLTHRDSIDVSRECCIALYNLVGENEEAQEQVGSATEVLKVLVASSVRLTQKKIDPNRTICLLQWIWYVLSMFSKCPGNRAMLFKYGVCDCIIDLLKKEKELNRIVVLYVCVSLSNMTTLHESAVYMGEEGVSRGIFLCATNYGDDIEICLCLAQAVGTLAQIPASRVWLGAAGVCSSVVNILENHQNNLALIESTLHAVAHLSDCNKSNCRKLGGAGACQLLPKLLLKFGHGSTTVAEWGCASANHLSDVPEHVAQLGDNRGCKAFAHVWMHHASNNFLIENICNTVVNMSKSSKNLIFFKSTLVHRAITKTINSQLEDPVLMNYTVHAIKALVVSTALQSQFGEDALFCKLLVALLRRYQVDHDVLLQKLCSLVASIAYRNHVACELLADAEACEILATSLNNHHDNADLTIACLGAINNVADTLPNRRCFGNLGVCGVVIKYLKNFSKNATLVVHLCRLMGTLALDDADNRSCLHDVNIYEVSVAVLREHHCEYPLVVKFCCRAIANMSVNEDNRRHFGAYGTCEIIIECCETHMLLPHVLAQVILAIGSLAGKDFPNNSAKLGALGACRYIGTALETHPDEASVAWSCCRALNSLETEYDSMEENESGKAIMVAMHIHNNDEQVLQWGCQAIGSIALDDRNRDVLVASGACEAVVGALQRGTHSGEALMAVMMQKQIGNELLALAACTAAYSLCYDHQGYRDKLGALGGCEATVKILQKYDYDEFTASAGCKLIVALSLNQDVHRTRLGNAGCSKTLLCTLDKHQSSLQVALWGCRAIEGVVDGHQCNASKMGATGVCGALAVAMQTHQASAEVAGAGCGAIASLTICEHNIAILGAAGACESVISAMQRHGEDYAVAWKGFQAIANLAVSEGNIGWLGAAGGCEAVMAAVKQHSASASMAHLAWRCVGNLSIDLGNVVIFGREGGCEICLTALQSFQHSAVTVIELCRTLTRLSKNEKNSEVLLKNQCCPVLATILRELAEDSKVVLQVYKAVFSICNMREEAQRQFSKCNGCIVLLDTLRAQGQNCSLVARWGCVALRGLLIENASNQTLMEVLGTGKLVIQLLLFYFDNDEVVGDGLAVLRFLMESHLDNSLVYSTPEFVDIVMKLLLQHTENVPSALNCCYLIILLLPVTIPMFLDNVARIESILAAVMHSHVGRQEEVVVICCDAAAKLAATPDGAPRFGKAGFVRIAAKALQTHDENITVCISALQLLLVLSKSSSNTSQFNDKSVCHIVVRITQKYFLRKRCTEMGCAVIRSLAGNSDKVRLLLISEGAIDLLTVILHTYASKRHNAPVWAHSTMSFLTT
jgi:hypothetical protein